MAHDLAFSDGGQEYRGVQVRQSLRTPSSLLLGILLLLLLLLLPSMMAESASERGPL